MNNWDPEPPWKPPRDRPYPDCATILEVFLSSTKNNVFAGSLAAVRGGGENFDDEVWL